MTTASKEATTKQDISPEARAVADRVKAAATIAADTGIAEGLSSQFTEHRDAAGITHQQILDVKKLERDFANGVTLGLGEAGIDVLEKNKDLQSVTAEVPMFQDRGNGFNENFGFQLNRTATTRNPQTGETSEVYAAVRTDYRVSTGTNRGEMTKIRGHLREIGTSKLA